VFGIWLYLNIPKIVTTLIVKPPYVAQAKLTGITLIVFDKQKMQDIIVIMQKIVGYIFVKLFVTFKKLFDEIPKIIARIKYIYPAIRFIKPSPF